MPTCHNPRWPTALAALCLAPALLTLGGCMASEDYVSLRADRSEVAAPLGESLFPDDQAVMSNEAIRQVLESPTFVPADARLAVFRHGGLPYWWGWSDDFTRTGEQLDADFLARLDTSDRLTRVAYVPSLVMPRRTTIPYLREAAVRMQSDLLLVYRTSTGTYTNRRLIAADEVRAYCTVEAILLDVRTGTIPFSTVVTEQYEARKQRQDKNFEETVAKASQAAMGRAWLRLADETVAFLADTPLPPGAETQPVE